MANARGKSIDNTHLSIDQAENRGFIHRDYIAHCLRWTHVCNFLTKKQRYKTARILDIGCGVDLPLAKLLYSSRLIVEEYVGVDYNKSHKFDLSPFHTGKMTVHAYGGIDATKDITFSSGLYWVGDKDSQKLPNIITCFEVLEHIEPGHCRKMLTLIHQFLEKDSEARAFISTPCWDPHVGAANNHVSEIKYEAFGALLEDLGFEIKGHWGTFASQKDYKKIFFNQYPDAKAMWDRLSEYYDTNYLATIFAPMYPHLARNCLWQVKTKDNKYNRLFPKLKEVERPWTSSTRWKELAR